VRRLFGRSKDQPGPGPEYSHVDSREKAEELVARGELTRLHLLPLEFGGTDATENLVFVPPFVVDLKHGTDTNIIRPLIEDGSVSEYSATPTYAGKSFVPTSIEIRAANPGDFQTSLEIWG
jgi:hypothetical protein